jgi:hypothetical protein
MLDRDKVLFMEFWRRDDKRVAQRFYVAFCLFMSSVQDAFLGKMLRERKNLNWSATCSYYALVHTGRFLCFLAVGDFPTNHGKLRNLYKPSKSTDRCQSDWLSGFSRLTGDSEQEQVQIISHLCNELRSVIIVQLELLGVADCSKRLESFGRTLAEAGPLRNDSNYEALLIAHEFRHDSMEGAFDRLSEAMCLAAERAILFARDAFQGFMRLDQDLGGYRESYQAFAKEYVEERLIGAINKKLEGSLRVQADFREFVSAIQLLPGDASFMHLEEMVSVGVFGQKAALMGDFERKVRLLADQLRIGDERAR